MFNVGDPLVICACTRRGAKNDGAVGRVVSVSKFFFNEEDRRCRTYTCSCGEVHTEYPRASDTESITSFKSFDAGYY